VRPVPGRAHSAALVARRNSPALLGAVNEWIEDKQQKNNSFFDRLYKKYFVDRRNDTNI
jgi:hypothetical protein